MINWSKKNWLKIIIFVFVLSRIYLIASPPYVKNDPQKAYSDVKHDYERYANMWYYGLTPYLEHYYEYPPATIPLLLFPLWLDQKGIGKYYFNYRMQIVVIDIVLLAVILKVLNKLRRSREQKILALGFYLFASFLIKDYWYDGIDLAFISALVGSLASLLYFSPQKIINQVFLWIFFWLSTAIKFISLPLLPVLFYLKKIDFKKEFLTCLAGLLFVWGIPLALFRTSLSVSFVFYFKRKLKYASFPSFIVETINAFTQSETKSWQPPDMPWLGPVSTTVQQIFEIIFPISVFLIVVGGVLSLLKKPFKKGLTGVIEKLLFFKTISLTKEESFRLAVKISLILIFTIFITGKVFSFPFHIWYVPLLVIFPYRTVKEQKKFIKVAGWLLLVSFTTFLLKFENIILFPPLKMNFFTTCLRFIPVFILLYLSARLPVRYQKNDD